MVYNFLKIFKKTGHIQTFFLVINQSLDNTVLVCGIDIIVGIVSNLQMIYSIWDDRHKLCGTTVLFYMKHLRILIWSCKS